MGKKRIYLAGAIESAKDGGTTWRNWLTPRLKKAGFVVMDPVVHEREKLRSLDSSAIPSEFIGHDGQRVEVSHWHQLRLAPKKSDNYRAYLKRIHLVIDYDMSVMIRDNSDVLFCRWDKATSNGAGTHAEVTYAYLLRKLVILVDTGESPVPGWIQGCAVIPGTETSTIVYSLSEGLKLLKRLTCGRQRKEK